MGPLDDDVAAVGDEAHDWRVETVAELVADLLTAGHVPVFLVRGVSMHPTLKEGDNVTLAPLGVDGAKPGDIVAFRRGPHLVLHRVLAVEKAPHGVREYLTSGDGLMEDDGVQAEDAVLGKVRFVVTPVGTWRPDSLGRQLQGAVRVFLGRHPRARRRLGSVKVGLRRVMAPSVSTRQKAGAKG